MAALLTAVSAAMVGWNAAGAESARPRLHAARPLPGEKLLETLTIPFKSAGVTTQTSFNPSRNYRFIFTGSVNYAETSGGDHWTWSADSIGTCFNETGGVPGCPGEGGLAFYGGIGGATESTPEQVGNLDPSAAVQSYDYIGRPHLYQIPYTPVFPNGSLAPLSGELTFEPFPSSFPYETAGSWTVQIYEEPLLVIGLGDSLAAGEGNPDTPKSAGHPAVWQSEQCDRSAKNFEHLSVNMVQSSLPNDRIDGYYLGCSGASIEQGLVGGYQGINPGDELPPQINEARSISGAFTPNAVLISIGINDLHFGDIASFCAHKGEDGNCPEDIYKNHMTLTAWLDNQFDILSKLYDGLEYSLTNPVTTGSQEKALVPANRVFITQYPDILSESPDQTCPEILFTSVPVLGRYVIDSDEVDWLYKNLLVRLDTLISTKATQYGWHLITAPPAFESHGYCTPAADSWTVTYAESNETQGNQFGALHPNLMGQTAIANELAQSLQAFLPSS